MIEGRCESDLMYCYTSLLHLYALLGGKLGPYDFNFFTSLRPFCLLDTHQLLDHCNVG